MTIRARRAARAGLACCIVLAASGATASPALSAPLEAPVASLTGLAGDLANPVTGGANPIDALTAGAGWLADNALKALGSWVLGGASGALHETASVISRTTRPHLESAWFSSAYWRVAGLAAVLTLPFLFAAAIQALVRSDLGLLLRAAFGYLPLSLIGVSVAAPVTMLLLAATDEMCSIVAGAGVGGGVHFLNQTAREIAGSGGLGTSSFLGFAIGLLTLAAAIALALEMLIREAAVYIVVLMLPLAFAGLVWPARRVWAVRVVELVIALILSKFVIVAVLSLAGSAYGVAGTPSTTRLLTAMALVLLSTFAPWVMLRLLPFTEVAAGAAGAIRAETPRLATIPATAMGAAETSVGWAEALVRRLRREDDSGDSDAAGSISRMPMGGGRTSTPQDAGGPGRPGGFAGASGAGPAEAHSGRPPGEMESWLAEPIGEVGGAASDGSIAPPAVASTPAGRDERLPGMEPIWQAPDNGWPPMHLDPGDMSGPAAYVPPPGGPSSPPSSHPTAGEDDPPLPPSQREENGAL